MYEYNKYNEQNIHDNQYIIIIMSYLTINSLYHYNIIPIYLQIYRKKKIIINLHNETKYFSHCLLISYLTQIYVLYSMFSMSYI